MSDFTIFIFNRADRKRYELQDASELEEIPLKEWLGSMLKKLEIPSQGSDGEKITYTLRLKRSGKILTEDDTLHAAGVVDRDVIELLKKTEESKLPPINPLPESSRISRILDNIKYTVDPDPFDFIDKPQEKPT